MIILGSGEEVRQILEVLEDNFQGYPTTSTANGRTGQKQGAESLAHEFKALGLTYSDGRGVLGENILRVIVKLLQRVMENWEILFSEEGDEDENVSFYHRGDLSEVKILIAAVISDAKQKEREKGFQAYSPFLTNVLFPAAVEQLDE
jgi:hypothetical protein